MREADELDAAGHYAAAAERLTQCLQLLAALLKRTAPFLSELS